jgi:amino acid adenylation domain-containing protein
MDRKNVEDLYLLSPLQQGMLFHTLYSPGSAAYVEQLVLVLGGRPRAAELRRAWQMVVERHSVLRTGFIWEGVPKPLQVVFRKVDVPWQEHDWSALPEAEVEARWARLLEEDRERGFDLPRAPLLRFTLVRTAADEHRLLWTSHHILTDGWSVPIVLGELSAIYHGLLAGAPPRLRPARPFREYIAWLNRQDAAAAERYWTARLAGIDEPTPVPLDRAPALAGDPPPDHAGETLYIPPEAVAALDEAARRMRVTSNSILQGAWSVVLARAAAVDEVVFGTTVSGRPPELPGVNEMVGMFINTIPVRVRVDDALPVEEWIRGVHHEHVAAGEFEHAPLAEVQKWAGAHEKAGLFESLLVYENFPLGMGGEGEDDGTPPPDGALELTGMSSAERTDLPLSVTVGPASVGMRLSATYDPRRLSEEDVRRLLAGLGEVVAQISGGATERVADLSPFTAEDRRRPLECWSGRVTESVRDSVPALFQAAAAATPDAVAVRADGAALTYAELNAAANRLARHLRAHGVGVDGRVGVSMERSAELVVALLAILKAGAAYVPLDPGYPDDRLAYMRRDSGTELVLVADDAPAWTEGARVVSLAAEKEAIAARCAEDLEDVGYDADALAYVVYTSGSTGEPKGVAVPHRAVVRLVRGADWVRLGADETLLLLAPVAFDASTFEIWGALLNGSALVVHPPEVPDPARLGAFLRDQGVTTLWMTAGLFHQVVDADPSSLAGVHQVLTGGDVVSPAHVRRLLDAVPEIRVINGYGPTENTTFTTTHTVRAEDLNRPSLPIGKPVAGTQAYVVDGRMRPLPAGVPGELVTGGEGVARGYVGRPGLTAEKFVPDPFGAPGSRLYRTGDRVRWADDGTVEFLGRIDRQLKVRGFRIEPGEIEAALKSHPLVGDAVVTARTDGASGKRLVAYVVPRDGARPAPGALRDALAGRMPGHMVPSAFVVLDALPLTPNGKVDRRALPAPEVEMADGHSAPQSPVEEVIAGLWSELLGVPSPGRDDDFFVLGGHSLLATQLVSRVRKAFSVELPLRALFESPTLAGMAEQVDRALAGGTVGAVPPLVAGEVEGVDLPLSFAQEGLWFVDRLNPGSAVYNVPLTTRLLGPLDVEALRRAMDELVRRHGSLRTRFVEVDGQPVQRVLPAERFELPLHDLSALPEAERAAEVRRYAALSAATPYDLARDPLFRARLLRLGEQEHVLLTAMHHIVCDGWSMGVFWGELVALYEAFTAGLPSPLPPLTLQYGDFARWQRGWITRDAVGAQVGWWRDTMAGAPALLTVPSDRPRPAVRTDRGALIHFSIDAELAESARSVARAEGGTLFMALLAAWSALLSRWSGQDDVVVGSPIAGRTQRETEELIGLFVNTVPIRADLSGAPPFRALLRRVREATLGAYAHQHLPFDQLVEELQPVRSLGYTPLFQAMLAFNNTPGAEGTGVSGLRMEGIEEAGGVARTDLTLSFAPTDDGSLVGSLEYGSELWDESTMRRLMAQLEMLLRAAVASPDAPVGALPLMTDEERQTVLDASAGPVVPVADAPLHSRFETQAARTPDATALVFGTERMSYSELDAKANQLAHLLRARAVGPDQPVAVLMERSMEMVVALYGILKAGAAYVPVDPDYPADRVAYMLADSAAALVLTQERWIDGLAEVDADAVALDAAGVLDAFPSHRVADADAAGTERLAYVIYTSGSTGRPKGAMNAHRGVVNRIAWMQDAFGLTADDAVLQKTPFSFDVSVWEFFWPLAVGARLVIAPPGAHREPATLNEIIQREGITTLHFVPSMLRAWLDGADASACTSLRLVMSSGEALPADLVTRFYGALPSGQLHNLYGPTEAAVDVTHWPCTADARATVPIGRPIANTRMYVLDPRGAPQPAGLPGELWIAGIQVGRGYWRRPGLTAERFVPDPFATQPGARMYRTGDLARWRELSGADGENSRTDALTHSRTAVLEYLGRTDFQVKVRGFRIELGEIEAALAAFPGVRQAVVQTRGAGEDARLVAWTVSDGADAEALRAHLSARLPDFMVPSAFVALDALPLTPNGKLDTRALPEPEAAAASAYVAPRNPVEELLAGIWAELLGVPRVGVGDGFFQLGGHSLMATRLVSRVRDAFGVEMPVRSVFEHTSLGAFAVELERARRASAGHEAPALRPVPRDGDLPLSFAQERLWFVDRLEPGSPVYHMSFPYLLKGTLDADALRRAWNEIVRRHETLRTALPFTGEQPVQRILPPAPVEVPLHDLSQLTEEERDTAADALIADVANRAFDLERGPLHRAVLARMADDEHLLLITLHHVISDGWSVGVIWGELSALYTAFLDGNPSPLPELAIQYGDFAVWQRAWLSGEVLDAQLGYWRRKLSGAPPLLELPTDRPRPAVQTYVGAEERLHLEGDDAEALRALARREGATLFMVLLAAMNVVFSRLSGQDDVVIGTPIAGRTRRETEALIGLFLNSLALRTDLSGQPSFREVLRRVRETTLDAYAHQDLPFERILQELAPERSLSHSPLFQVMLNVANFEFGEVSLPGLEVHGVTADTGLASKFDLTLYAGEGPDVIGLYLVYNTALFDADRVRSMLTQLAGVLRQAVEDAERPVGRMSLLTEEARSVLPNPDEALSPEWRGSVPEIFAAHAARMPDALAVEDPAERWTYAELDAGATEIARRLLADGVRPGDVVAIHGHRSAALVRALIGTLRAGAAFLVLDPAYPATRLAEYVRIARPTGWLPIHDAGEVAAELADALRETVVSTIPLGSRAEQGTRGTSADEGLPEIGPDSLAYLSFTSGTTGKPKAVMGRHGSLTHFTPWLAERFALGADDRFSMLSGLAHDPLHRDVFTPLQLGASIIAPDPDEVGTPGYLAQWMRAAGVTIAHLTPAMGQLLADVPAGDASDAIDSLRRAFFVGDVLTRTDVERLHRLAPNLQIINYYGSTETQRAVAHFVVPRDSAELAKDIIPVGVGIPDVQVIIRNAAGERAGVGEVGEMWMRSPHVALGYLGDPELTATRFVDGAYRTGDLGRYRPDGVAEIAGRADQQVKIRGFRIEPGEIEAALRAHPAVRDTAVVARGEADAKRLIAYVVAEGEAPTADAMRAYLKGQVPDYMVPPAWVFLSALPVTPNGKVDRRALPEPETSAPDAHVAPRTPTEAALAEIWTELLHAPVGAHDDFFALGGHSLLATRLVGRVRDALGVELPLRALFQGPTLATLAGRVDELLRDGAAAGPPPIVRRPHEGEAPASFAQERMWFVDRMEGGGPVYHIPTAQYLRGPVDVEAMRRAVEELVRRHETLRTALPETDGVPVQRIAPPGRVELPFIDLSRLSEEERSDQAEQLAERSANEPFDLEAGPLFRVSLLRMAEEDYLLLVNLHHAIGDGWSLRVLLGELTALHQAYRRGEPSPLPELPVQYADYAAWQREWLRGPVLDAQLGYWRQKLAGAPPLLQLPMDRPRPEVQGHRGASEALDLAGEDAARVAELARREGATLFMVLLAAFNLVLSRWSGEDEVVVGTPIAGRTRPELEGLIGLFLNSLALRTDLSGQPSFAEVLRRVRETTLEAYAHQDLPFERILEELKPERSLSHTPVFQVMLNLLNYGGEPQAPAGEEGGMTSLGAGAQLASKFDLTLYAAETADGIGLHAVYDADLFDAARMRALLEQMAAVLRQAAEDADRPAFALSLATGSEAERAAESSPVVVRTSTGTTAGIGELGEVCMRGPDGSLRPMGGAGRYRPDGSVELAAAPIAPPVKPVEAAPASAPAARSDEPGRAPRTETERMVAAVWAEVLAVPADGIAVDADFFALGGHSLRATQVLSRIRARTGVRLPIKTFFATPTIAAVAAAIEAEASAQPASAVAPGGSASTEAAAASTVAEAPHSRTTALTHSYPPGTYPLSFAQQRLWVLMQLGETAAYHLATALRLTGTLDDWALERAVDEIVRRHEALRIRIETRDGEPVQVVQPPRPVRLRAEEVRADGDTSVDDVFRAMAEEEAAKPFSPDGPFLRVRLLRAADDDHVLLWTTHHMVSDGWSVGIFHTEFETLYRSFMRGEPSPLPPLPVQYGQHALEQRLALSGHSLDALAAWWKEHLAGAPALLELPTDRPRPVEPSGEGASFWFTFPDGTGDRAQALARSRGATPFMVLLAAFQAFLSRWSGQQDVVVGTPIANRTRPELEGLIGFFANTLAIRGDLSGDPPFVALLERVRDATLGAYDHQDIPFERLVEELSPERSLSHSPVFQVMFGLQNAPEGEVVPIEGLAIEGLVKEREGAKYDLSLDVIERGDVVHGRVEYAVDLFDEATMERMIRSLIVLLDAALDRPETRLADLPLDDEDELGAVLDASAGPVKPVPDAPLHSRFETQAARTPDATALVFGTERMSYSELDAKANQLAHLLRARAVGPDQPVAVLMERSMEMVVALYGILKAGAAYVPVDPDYPADRVAYMLADSAAALVLTQERWIDGLAEVDADAVALDAAGVLDAFPSHRVADADAAGTERLAYVIYTSGSTGRPKGAMNAHRGVVNRIAWMQDAFGLTADDAVLQKTPFSFDVSVWEFFWPLAVGARLVIAPPGAHREPAVLNELIQREGITTLHFVPSMLRAWLDGADASACTSLRLVMSSGEALPADLVTRFYGALPSGQLHNLYGPTEAAVDVTHWPCTADAHATVPIGRPIANTRMYVLDSRGALQPAGLPGELWIAGIQVGRGYWRRPGLTAERFVPDPFATQPGARMYRTGDLARWRELADAEGENSRTDALPHSRTAVLEYLGRTDFQVKVRGFRIEPGEIEAALAAFPGVRQAVVDARPGPGGDRLVAWIAADGAHPSPVALRDGLARSLPEHMIPSVFVPVDALPLTPSGKVDRRALPDPVGAGQGGEYVPPRGGTEQLLAEVWAELLGIDRVGARDGFFALGGHSLLATRMISRVRELFGVELSLRAVFEAPVLRDLASRIERATREGDDPLAAPPLVPMAPENDAPLSFAQERLWFIERLAPGASAYTISPSLRLTGEMDAGALERALAELVRRHEPLRTAFRQVDETPVQHVLPPHGFRLPVDDLSERADGDAREAEVSRLATDFARAPFDLAEGPLFRARLVRVAPDDHVLLMAMHHAVADGWSLGILFGELFALYDAFRAGEPSPLPPLPVRYSDFAVWQRSWLRGEALERQLAYWRGRLAGAPALIGLPTDHPRPEVQGARGGSHAFTVPADVAASVRALARREGTTLFMTLLAAWNVWLARASGDADVVVGTPIAGRTRAETEGLIGLFVNTLALRTELSDDPDFRVLLGRVRETALGAFAHQDLPFEKLVEELRPERSLAHAPLFQVMFVWRNTPDGPSRSPAGLELAPVAREGSQAKVDLTLTMGEGADGELFAGLGYAAELFDAPSAARMAAQFVQLLGTLARDPDAPVSAVPLLADADRADVDAWGRTADSDLPLPLRVLDAHGQPVPAGIPGELCAAEPGHTDPDTSAIVSDPFGTGALLRRTGEGARWRGDGTLERLGRITARGVVRERTARPVEAGYVVPRDVTELQVSRIWSEALGAPRVGALDNFFHLGGHSLLGVRVMARIRERFGRDLPLTELFRHPTVAAFAALLRREGADVDDGSLLVALTPPGTRPPLIFFPPAGGTVTHYADLARLLGPDQPFLALQAPGVHGSEEPLWSVDAMVDRYLGEIRRAQPHGPYWLGGWSAGGVTAYEAARRLRAAGEEVALLAILDAPAPDDRRKATTPDRVELLVGFASSNVTGDEALLDVLREELRAAPAEERLRVFSRWMAGAGGRFQEDELESLGRVFAVFEATARAIRDYVDPPPLDVPAALFVAAEGKPEDGAGPEERPARWRPFLRGELSVHVVPGKHLDIVLEPAVLPLADALREVLERLRRR